MSKIIVAIDGPAASGKSTVAKSIADRMNFIYVDTGAMYRAITYLALFKNISNDLLEVVKLVKDLDINLKYENGITRVFINDEEVTEFIRSKEVNAKVSDISRIPEVRTELVKIQKRLGRKGNLIAEGRDTTTVVFPNADLKIFLDASLDVRTKRRYKEFLEKDMKITYNEVKANLKKRDEIDTNRKISPLRKADDAIEIDTSELSIEDEVNMLVYKVEEILNKKPS